MSTLVKTIPSDPIVLQEIAAGVAAIYSSPIDVAAKFAMQVAWDFSPAAPTASAFATVLQILGSTKIVGGVVDDEDDAWEVIQDYLSPTAQAVEFTSVVGTAGASTFTVASAAGLVLYQDHCIEGPSTNEAGSEWVYPIGVSGTTITIRGKLKNTYASGTLRSGALKQRFDIDLSDVGKIKFMLGNNRGGTERDVLSRVRILTLDSIAA